MIIQSSLLWVNRLRLPTFAPVALFALASLAVYAGDDFPGKAQPELEVVPIDIRSDDDWKFTLAPYGWAIGLDGTVGAAGISKDVDVDFRKIAENLDGAFLLHFEAQKGRWGLALDGNYLKVSDDAGTPGPLFSTINLELQEAIVDASIFYRIFEGDRGFVDLLVGARFNYVDVNLDLQQDSAGIRDFSRDLSASVIDSVADRLQAPTAGLEGRVATGISDAIIAGIKERIEDRLPPRFPLSGRESRLGVAAKEFVEASVAQRVADAPGGCAAAG